LEILKEVVPKLSRVAILRQIGRAGAETGAIESAARTLAMKVVFADVRIPTDIEGAFAAMTRSQTGAFLILGGSLTWASRQQIADLAVRHRLPGIPFSGSTPRPDCSSRTDRARSLITRASLLTSTRL
jgi:putative ABC transport system substrate-binding protein